MNRLITYLFVALILIALTSIPIHANTKNNVDEYSGRHNEKNIRMATTSKMFSWLSGSPADNEKLSIGKSAQFFGFVALRYQSDRSARRGDLGKAFHSLATVKQRSLISNASKKEAQILGDWWAARNKILRTLEGHLYISETLNEQELLALGGEFGLLNAEQALIEGKACAALEASLTRNQLNKLGQFRAKPEIASKLKVSRKDLQLALKNDQLLAHYEDIFAKCFTYITGTFKDREVIPLGQPAQFFGFVSMRHKSGRGVKRGKVSKQFEKLLNNTQKHLLQKATELLMPEVQDFMKTRSALMREMDKLRKGSNEIFNEDRYYAHAKQLGVIEARYGMIEAYTFRKIRISMSDNQTAKMMKIRSDYIIDDKNTELLTGLARGEKLYNICASCHESSQQLAPSLVGILNKQVASQNFDYSNAMSKYSMKVWDKVLLDKFIFMPNKTIPGNKMGFTGLLKPEDREALIQYLSTLQ